MATVLRLGIAFCLGINDPPDRNSGGADAVEFEHMAWTFSQGIGLRNPQGDYTAFRAPGYPIVLGTMYWLFGRRYFLNVIVQLIASLITIWLVHRVAVNLQLQRRASYLACGLISVMPLQMYYCANFSSEPLAGMFSIAVVHCLVVSLAVQSNESTRRFWIGFATAGILTGLNALVRPIAILIIPTLGLLLVLAPKQSRQRLIMGMAIFTLGTIVVLAPWTLRNYLRFDRFAIASSNGGSTFWGSNNPIVADRSSKHWGHWVSTNFAGEVKQRQVLTLDNEIDRDKMEYRLGIRFLMGHPQDVPELMLGKFVGFFRVFPISDNPIFRIAVGISELIFVPLWMIGCGLVWFGKQHRGRMIPLTAFVVVLMETALIFYMSLRFRAPTEPILAIFAGIAMASIGARIFISPKAEMSRE